MGPYIGWALTQQFYAAHENPSKRVTCAIHMLGQGPIYMKLFAYMKVTSSSRRVIKRDKK